MKTNGNDKALEAYKIFPYVAWTVIIFFTFFVYSLAMELKDVADNLQLQTEYTEDLSKTPVDRIRDFEQPKQ